MSILYFALLVPLIVTIIFYLIKKHKFMWWEFFIPIVSVFFMILISKTIINYSSIHFTEYWGSTITAVFEEEPYNEWHSEQCSYTTTDSKGNTTTHYYDCSHQENYGPEWYAVTNLNERFNISEKLHDKLVKQFGDKKFVIDSHNNYDNDDYCVNSNGTKFDGKEVGDKSNIYQTSWNGDDNTRKSYVSEHSYVNKIKATDLSIFNIKMVDEKDVDSLGLFRYPEISNGLDFPTILGGNVSDNIQEKFKRLNGKFGVSNQLRIWILIFENKPISIAQYQENYWVKGNMNELVICIGKKGNDIIWSHAFSWSLSDVLTVEVKNEVLNLYTYRDSVVKIKNPVIPLTKNLKNKVMGKVGKNLPDVLPIKLPLRDSIIKIKSSNPVLTEETLNNYYEFLNNNLNKFKRRTFKEFDYLTVEPSNTAVIWIYILAFIISIAVNIWVISNDFDDNNNDNRY